jgi:hypothetical protein
MEPQLQPVDGFASWTRTPMPRLSPQEAIGTFALVEKGYGIEEARREAALCLRCDLRLLIPPVPRPPDPWLEFNEENVSLVPDTEGVYQLLDEEKAVYAIKGVGDLREALTELLDSSTKAKYFLYDEDPMFSKRESELIQEYLKVHGCMPPGEGEDDLDDLF